MSRSNNLPFTLNNYTDEELVAIAALVGSQPCVKYIAYGKEVAESGTPHLQGVIVFNSKKTIQQAKVLIPRAHFEVGRGSLIQIIDYCKKGTQAKQEWLEHGVSGPNYGKELQFFEYGTRPLNQQEKGKKGGDAEKVRWDEVRSAAKKGKLDDISPEIYVRHYNTLKNIAKDHMTKPADLNAVSGVWISGPSGVGKSRVVRSIFGASLFDKMCNKWWDGYQGEKYVLLDDFDDSHKVLAHHLKRWGDRYSFTCEAKGNARCIRPLKIIVTSQYTPEQIWADNRPALDAIKRRFIQVPITLPADVQVRYDAVFNPAPIFNNVDVVSESNIIDDATFEGICNYVRSMVDMPADLAADDMSVLTAPTLGSEEGEPEPEDGETIGSEETHESEDYFADDLSFVELDEHYEEHMERLAPTSRFLEPDDVGSLLSFDSSDFPNDVEYISSSSNGSNKRRRVDLSDDEE